jgi:hypothetical protein
VKRHWLLVGIVGVFVAIGTVYSVATPIFETPDESFHFFVIQHWRETGQLPVQQPGVRTLYAQEGSQPPLYYLAGALLTSWINTSDATSFVRENPQANVGMPGDPGNKNRFIHTDRESWPWQGTPLAVHVLRFFSLLLGVVVIVCTYAAARIIFPDRNAVVWFATAIVAFTPQFIFIASAVNNDNAINALCAAAIYLLARMWRGDRSRRTSIALGVTVALATLAKLGGLVLLGYALAVIVYLVWTHRADARQARRWGLFSIASIVFASAAIGGWWYLRNAQLYGDLTGLSGMYLVVGQRALTLSELIAELPGLWYSIWGVFGWFNIALPDGLFLAYGLLVLAALVGGAVAIVRWWKTRQRSASAEVSIGLALYVLLVFIGVLRWTATTPGSQGRLLFPALSALAILLAAGLSTWMPPRWSAVLSIGLALAAAVIPFVIIAPEYARPKRIVLNDVPANVQRINVDFNGTIRLIGGKIEVSTARPGELVPIVLYWQALRRPDREYMVFVHLLGRDLELVSSEDAYHGQGTFPTDLWRGDEVIADRFTLRLKDEARTPTLVRAEIGLRDRTAKEPVAITNEDGSPRLGLTVVDVFRLPSPSPPPPSPSMPMHYRFGDMAELTGHDIAIDVEKRLIVYRLYWHVLKTPPVDYTVFAHLVDASGKMIANGDSQPFNGDYPTTQWQAGEQFVEDRTLPLPQASGDYRIFVGLYQPPNDERLPVTNVDGQPVENNEVFLDSILR